MLGAGGCSLEHSEVAAGPDRDSQAETLKQGAGTLHRLGRHAEFGCDSLVRGRDVAAGARVRNCGVGGRNPQQGVDRDMRRRPDDFPL